MNKRYFHISTCLDMRRNISFYSFGFISNTLMKEDDLLRLVLNHIKSKERISIQGYILSLVSVTPLSKEDFDVLDFENIIINDEI